MDAGLFAFEGGVDAKDDDDGVGFFGGVDGFLVERFAGGGGAMNRTVPPAGLSCSRFISWPCGSSFNAKVAAGSVP